MCQPVICTNSRAFSIASAIRGNAAAPSISTSSEQPSRERLQTFSAGFGDAHVFYSEATEDRCTAALLLAIDPVGLVRRGRGVSSFALAEYVNDRPYVASSFMSVALVSVFKSAMEIGRAHV